VYFIRESYSSKPFFGYGQVYICSLSVCIYKFILVCLYIVFICFCLDENLVILAHTLTMQLPAKDDHPGKNHRGGFSDFPVMDMSVCTIILD